MRRLSALLITPLLLLVFLAAGCDSPPPMSRLAPDAVILAFGDSLTRGTGARDNQAYPIILQELLGREVVNAGIPGEISADGLKRLPGVLEEYQPDLVILCHGGNDFLRRMDNDRIATNLRAMVNLIRQSGAGVLLVGVPQFGFVLEPPAFYREIATEYKIPYEEEIISDLLSDRSLKSDNIHPNAAGYRLMAEAIHTLIQDAEGV